MSIRVLIVDDTDSMRELMRSHVVDAGMDVAGEAVDGLHAVGAARETQPDAVILDVEMPVMDGLQALPGVIAAAPNTKVVVFSSRPPAATADAARARGAVGVFYKGHDKSREVVDYVRSLFPADGA